MNAFVSWWNRLWIGRKSPTHQVSAIMAQEIQASQWTPDARSAKNIATLEPTTAKLATELLRRLSVKGHTFKVICGTRSIAEQDRLYAQGRTALGNIVTKAKGGYSWHNFGLAFDIALFDGRKVIWESPAYAEAGQIGEQLGLVWGGRFKTLVDKPHFQRPIGKTLAQMRKWPHGTSPRLSA